MRNHPRISKVQCYCSLTLAFFLGGGKKIFVVDDASIDVPETGHNITGTGNRCNDETEKSK